MSSKNYRSLYALSEKLLTILSIECKKTEKEGDKKYFSFMFEKVDTEYVTKSAMMTSSLKNSILILPISQHITLYTYK